MPIFYLIEFRLAKGKKKGTTGVPSRFWGQKFLKTGAGLEKLLKPSDTFWDYRNHVFEPRLP